jgi:hypothetical protein
MLLSTLNAVKLSLAASRIITLIMRTEMLLETWFIHFQLPYASSTLREFYLTHPFFCDSVMSSGDLLQH